MFRTLHVLHKEMYLKVNGNRQILQLLLLSQRLSDNCLEYQQKTGSMEFRCE